MVLIEILFEVVYAVYYFIARDMYYLARDITYTENNKTIRGVVGAIIRNCRYLFWSIIFYGIYCTNVFFR